jgi:hypothetical protein
VLDQPSNFILGIPFPFSTQKTVDTPFVPRGGVAFDSGFLGYAGFLNSEYLPVDGQPKIRRILSPRNLLTPDDLITATLCEIIFKRINRDTFVVNSITF